MKRLKIDLADRGYEILIGRDLLPQSGELLLEILNPSRVVVMTHPPIHRLYGEKIRSGLARAGLAPAFIEVPEGESSKSLQQAEKLYDRLLELNCDRQSVLIALGGGVIGDLTGFVAATYMRGVAFLQVPTTLLAQVDSSVGGKTAVNHPRGKNMIGVFHQPRVVIVDIETLKSLPENQYKSGLAEVIKHGIIADSNLFGFLEKNVDKILARDPECLEHIIERSCVIKAEVVERDEREGRYRMVLNFGHTLGHAIESLTGYSGLLHGEAVAIGMVHAADLSKATGRCSEAVPKRIFALVEKFGLPVRVPDLKTADIIQSMYLDKKAVGGKIRYVLVKEIGSVEIVDQVPEQEIKKVLD